MRKQLTSILAALSLLAGAAPALAMAARPASPPPASPAPMGTPQTLDGHVQSVQRDADGRITGFTLGDGSMVHTPAHASPQLEAALKPGAHVVVSALAMGLNGQAQFYQALTVTNADTNTVVVLVQPGYAQQQAPLPNSVTGVLFKYLVVGSQTVGLYLNRTTEVRFSPQLAAQVRAIAKPGDQIEVKGWYESSGSESYILAQQVTNLATKQTVTLGEVPPSPWPSPASATP